jgi:predicted AAA+ superfamily ATPase
VLTTLHPFMAAELGAAFDLTAALRHGLLPLVKGATDPEATLRSYVALYLKEEVQMEGLVRRLGHFSRFLEALSFSHGAVLNAAHVARDCSVHRSTVESYLSILQDLLLAFTIPVFTKRAKRHLSHHPKFFYVDPGVFRTIRPAGPIDAPEEIGGAALEGLIAQHVRAWNAYTGERHQLSFWRTKAGLEVDLVLYGPEAFLAIEVKNTRTIHPEALRGLRAFHEDYPAATLVYLYRGRERLKMSSVLCLPCEEFLTQLIPGQDVMKRLRG